MTRTSRRGALDWNAVGEAVTVRRGELGLSQEQAAALADVGITTWRLIEGAKRDYYRPNNLAGVARALQWPPDALLRLARGEPTSSLLGGELISRLSAVEDRVAAVEEKVDAVLDRLQGVGEPA